MSNRTVPGGEMAGPTLTLDKELKKFPLVLFSIRFSDFITLQESIPSCFNFFALTIYKLHSACTLIKNSPES